MISALVRLGLSILLIRISLGLIPVANQYASRYYSGAGLVMA